MAAEPELVAVVTAIDQTIKAFLLPQIDAMKAAGLRVLAVCSPGPAVTELRDRGLEMHPIVIAREIAPLSDVLAIWRMRRLFRRRRVKFVHTHTPKAAFLGQVAAKLAGVPVRINTVHGLFYVAYPRGLRRELFRRLELLACRLATHIFCVSEEDDPVLSRHLPPGKIEAIGNGVNLDRFNPANFDAEARLAIRRELDIPPDAFVIGIVARMVREKGLCELIDAFARLHRDVPTARLLHAGPIDRSRGDEVSPDLAAQLGVADACRFVGQRDDIPRLLAAMDVYCLPSYREGYPVSVIEASAMGLPAVVTDVRGCREAVKEGVNGLLVPPRQVEPLVAALRRLHDDVDLRRRLSVGARRRARELFDERSIVRRILAVYERLRSASANM